MGNCSEPANNTMPTGDTVQADSAQMSDEQIFPDDFLSNPAEIHFSCENLANKDLMSKSDPFIILYEQTKGFFMKRIKKNRAGMVEIGRTEVIQDNLNPKFVKPITAKYKFEERQLVFFNFYLYNLDEN